MANQPQNPVQTIPITNFGGRLTRKLNGDLNSGFAKFVPSWGYDPFSKPDNLTWLEAPVDITGSIGDLIVAAKPRFSGNVQEIYAIGNSGSVYTIQPNSPGNPNNPNLDTTSVIGGVSTPSSVVSFNYGASMDFYGAPEKIYVRSDNNLNSLNFDGSGSTEIGNANFLSPTGGPLKQFIGTLLIGNGNTIAQLDSTLTITSSVIGTGQGTLYSALNPPLPTEQTVHDLDLTVDGNYALITSSGIANEPISIFGDDRPSAASSDGNLYQWNGADPTVTASNSIPSYAVTALQTYLQNNTFFSQDAFGASLNDGTNKILSLPNNKSPLPNATLVNGNFISWIAPEVVGSNMVGSMYYFGSLDQENAPGLWRLMRYSSTLSTGFIYQTPVNLMVNGKYTTLNSNKLAVSTFGYGKHYFSVWDLNSTTNSYKLLRFLVTPTGSGTPQLGVYETQTQLFSQRISVEQIRVYCEPTATGNGFQLDLIGADGNVITNGTFTYSYAGGGDITLLQGALPRIDFNPQIVGQFALGLRITNTGTTNMTIKKIEVDWSPSGK